jgi:hypothetical protein
MESVRQPLGPLMDNAQIRGPSDGMGDCKQADSASRLVASPEWHFKPHQKHARPSSADSDRSKNQLFAEDFVPRKKVKLCTEASQSPALVISARAAAARKSGTIGSAESSASTFQDLASRTLEEVSLPANLL